MLIGENSRPEKTQVIRKNKFGSPGRFELATLRLTAVSLISSQVAGAELNRGKSASSDQIGVSQIFLPFSFFVRFFA